MPEITGSGSRHHHPADPECPLRSLSAGPLLSAVGGGWDHDTISDDGRRVAVDVHTETSSIVRPHISGPSDR